MAFWGIEVSSSNSYTHRHDHHCGRLRITQATLGIEIVRAGCGTNKSVILQCTVGKRRPIFLCSLIPGEMETASLQLEFEEIQDVVFSVIGSRSVHVAGYFLAQIEIDAEDGRPPNTGAACGTLMQTRCSGDNVESDEYSDQVLRLSPMLEDEGKVENKRKKKKRKTKKKKIDVKSSIAEETIKETNAAAEEKVAAVKEKVIEYEYEYEYAYN